eukprot:scaffold22_cov93-Cylindrotheca_fusiformis.AAC.3
MAAEDSQPSASSLLAKLSVEEKLSLLTGDSVWTIAANYPRLGINSSIRLSDGPHGIRKPLNDLTLQESHPATCFPTGSALACSWSTKRLLDIGEALSKECCYFEDIKVLLGPAMNLKRHPGGGRNLEYFSEDPVLTGKLAAAYVRGVQASGQVSACVKHFAANNQETHRMVVNTVVDERTLRELYLRSFEITLQEAGPKFVMGAYNKLNDQYCCNNEWLLQSILRDEWNFQGICVTDWGATDDRVQSIKTGMDLEMPGTGTLHHADIESALESGRLNMKEIEICAERILAFLLESSNKPNQVSLDQQLFDVHHELAHEVSMECAVLLKNENKILPLARNTKVALIGDFAKGHPRFQGMGSSHVSPTRVSNAYDAMTEYTDSILFAPGYNADEEGEAVRQDMIDEAIAVAEQSQVVVLMIGLPEILESEGFDRTNLKLPNQHIALIEFICQNHENVVVVLNNGGTVELPESLLQARAILEGYLLGQAAGSAIVDLLFGKASPSGKLPETMPICVNDIPAASYFPGTRDAVEYREGLDVGYRYFNSSMNSIPVQFPFGFGLTYTTFEYSNLQVEIQQDTNDCKRVQVSLQLLNSGTMEAKEVVQLYVCPLNPTVYRPYHELKAFSKLFLQPDQQDTVTFLLTERDFAFFDIGIQDWIVEDGASFEIQVGSSSRDIHLKQNVVFSNSGSTSSMLARQSYPVQEHWAKGDMIVDDEVFANRFGARKDALLEDMEERRRAMDDPRKVAHHKINRNSLMKEISAVSRLGALVNWIVFRLGCQEIQPGPYERREVQMVRENVANLPLRSLALYSKGMISFSVLDPLIVALNGYIGLAICQLTYNSFRALIGWTRSKLNV